MATRSIYKRCPRCGRTHENYKSLCVSCSPSLRAKDNRPSPSKRGYDAEWKRIRESVLISAGIPKSEHPKYHVDHNPPYDPNFSTNHNDYQLIPMLAAEHNSKTAREDVRRDSSGRIIGRGGVNLES